MSSSSSSSSKTHFEEKCVSLILACNANCLLSSAFRQLHFSATPLLQLPKSTLGTPIDEKIRNLRASFAAAADRFVRALQAVAAENPLSLHLRSFSQVRARNSLTPNSLSVHNFAAILPGDSVAGLVVANGVSNFLNIYNTLLVVRLVLTWFPNSPPAIVSPLSTICDPYLNIFRGLIPPLGGLDLSPILAFLVLNAFTSTAAALPAELPTTAASQTLSSSPPNFMNITKTQEKWMRRTLCRNGTRTSDDAN